MTFNMTDKYKGKIGGSSNFHSQLRRPSLQICVIRPPPFTPSIFDPQTPLQNLDECSLFSHVMIGLQGEVWCFPVYPSSRPLPLLATRKSDHGHNRKSAVPAEWKQKQLNPAYSKPNKVQAGICPWTETSRVIFCPGPTLEGPQLYAKSPKLTIKPEIAAD